MIVKERTVPNRIRQNQALLRRLPKNHFKRKEIEEDLAKRMAGFRGEQSLDYYLRFLPRNKFIFLHDIRLANGTSFFQIDTLILSENILILVEVKNISGTLTFDPVFDQFIRTQDGREERFLNPLTQADRQHQQLRKWLVHHQFIAPTFPLEYLVINSNPYAIIKSTQENMSISEKFIHIEHAVDKISNIEKRYNHKVIDRRQLQKISNIIVDKNQPLYQNVMEIYQLPVTEVQMGVQCQTCLSFHMVRKWARWECRSCGDVSQMAGAQAVIDYLLLIGPTINNQQCREFLQIPSRKEAYRLLKSMDLSESGSYRDKRYFSTDFGMK